MEKDFSFIAVEGDWPDCYKINRYVKHYSDSGSSSKEVLMGFNRWPTWMWGNWEMVAFIDWLKDFNMKHVAENKIGFYGLDVYSFNESMEAIISYLKKNDLNAYHTALNALKCFEPYEHDEGHSYAKASAFVPSLCEREILDLLTEIQNKLPTYNTDFENVFSTEQNAIIAVNAEKYYRAMIKGGAHSWNIRDKHMLLTINRLVKQHGKNSKVIIWEHNTHIGDARATDMAADGMVNVGQLLKEQYGKDRVKAVGFGSFKGSVIAGSKWGGIIKKIDVPEARPGSWEHLYHKASKGIDQILLMNDIKKEECLFSPIDHRAIGVVYNPEYEKFGNYVPSIMPERYDAFVFIDETKALFPLKINLDNHQIPETYPFGF